MKFDAELARDGSVDPVDKALYAAIGSFVDAETRESPDTGDLDPNNIPPWVPTRKRLAECVGKSVDTVDRSTKRLEAYGLLRVHRRPDPDNPRRMLPSEYELLDHHLWDERAARRAAERANGRQTRSSGGSRTGGATPGRTGAATPGRTGAAVKDLGESVKEEGGEAAPSARSAGDARRAPTGSGGRAARGGSAATGKTSASTGKDSGPGSRRQALELTREQAAAVAIVEAAVPAALAELLPYCQLPTRVRTAIVAELTHRTPDQLAARVARRWDAHGYADAHHSADGAGLRRPVAVAHALIRSGECPDATCEDGTMVDTREPCRTCAARREDRRAARRTSVDVPTPRPADGRPGWWECVICRDPWRGEAPEHGECQRCQDEAAAAVQRLTEQWAREAAEREGQPISTV